nr:uncharacterized protein LOC127347215 [Lolium perenne]
MTDDDMVKVGVLVSDNDGPVRVIGPVGGGAVAADEVESAAVVDGTDGAAATEETGVAGEEAGCVAAWGIGDTGDEPGGDRPELLESHAREAGAAVDTPRAAVARPGAGACMPHAGTKPEVEPAKPPAKPLHGSTQPEAGLAKAVVVHGCAQPEEEPCMGSKPCIGVPIYSRSANRRADLFSIAFSSSPPLFSVKLPSPPPPSLAVASINAGAHRTSQRSLLRPPPSSPVAVLAVASHIDPRARGRRMHAARVALVVSSRRRRPPFDHPITRIAPHACLAAPTPAPASIGRLRRPRPQQRRRRA